MVVCWCDCDGGLDRFGRDAGCSAPGARPRVSRWFSLDGRLGRECIRDDEDAVGVRAVYDD